uniref:hypothetical protein n=1 Tax=Burkholderia vietnamiensis TaxID=60552 RepID=UPI001590DE03
KLYDVYRSVDSLEQIDAKTARMIQDKYFQRSFEAVYEECRKHYPAEIIAAVLNTPFTQLLRQAATAPAPEAEAVV